MSLLALWFVPAASALEIKVAPCPPSGSCVQRLLAIEGEIEPWPELAQLREQVAPAVMDLYEIELEILSGLVEIRVDGRTLALADAQIPRGSTYVWYVPAAEGRDVHFEVVSLQEGTSTFNLHVYGATSGVTAPSPR